MPTLQTSSPNRQPHSSILNEIIFTYLFISLCIAGLGIIAFQLQESLLSLLESLQKRSTISDFIIILILAFVMPLIDDLLSGNKIIKNQNIG
ncbi:MAG: hypothetical protein N3E45_05945 [Oscillatoriaceae bacterium SKW80]|nr:hypothetical protein [Oscillatoriaceae bacterium SKYG93]MCX8120356.1 hypothetical protein [Oscillatoriaceae bacterium SKW80]MDW8453282.1 hypothetical protein [Oscillatoriaceae cyanobacterium SKYGB_i_bin93]HIK27276.1 hypothetical protein [Oscillatoriaceae cyanobacterium M7585_C2015_266]